MNFLAKMVSAAQNICMPIRRRESGAWLVDRRIDGIRYRKTLPASMSLEQVKAFESEPAAIPRVVVRRGRRTAIRGRSQRSLWTKVYDNARHRAKRKGQPFTLSREDFDLMVIRANGRCELTGLTFSWEPAAWARRPFAPSIDRIACSKPYSPSNCRLICVALNYAINEWGEETFALLASAYAKKILGPNSGTRAANP